MPDQIQTRCYAAGEVTGPNEAMHVHVVNMRVVPKEMVVKRGDLDAVVQECGHDRIHLVLTQHPVTHHYVSALRGLGKRKPAAETERRGRGHTLDGHLEIITRNVDLEDTCLKIAFAVEELQHVLIVA